MHGYISFFLDTTAKRSAAFWLGLCINILSSATEQSQYCFLAWFSGQNSGVTVFLHIRFDVITEQMAVKLGMQLQNQLLIPEI